MIVMSGGTASLEAQIGAFHAQGSLKMRFQKDLFDTMARNAVVAQPKKRGACPTLLDLTQWKEGLKPSEIPPRRQPVNPLDTGLQSIGNRLFEGEIADRGRRVTAAETSRSIRIIIGKIKFSTI
jgi:hypothetical protein